MNKFNLPTNWNGVSIRQFNELREIEDSASPFMKQVLIFSILADIDPDDKLIENMDIVELSNMLSHFNFLMEVPSDKIKTKLNNFKLIDLNNLKLGEFIDLDYYLSQDPIKNLAKIASILYRNYDYDIFNNIKLEDYDNINLDDRNVYFESISINDTFGLINHISEFKLNVYNNYANLFNPILNEDDLDPEDLDDPITQKEIEKEKSQAKWSWEFILHNLSKGDVTKYNDILNLPLIFILNQLSFKKDFALE